MLVISRRIGEEIVIGENVRLVVSAIAGNRVKLSIDAPESIRILRPEREGTEECEPPRPLLGTSMLPGTSTLRKKLEMYQSP